MNTITPAFERTVPSPAPGSGTGRATAKAILFGEHSVLYGSAALAVPVTALPVEAVVTAVPGDVDRLHSTLYAGRVDRAPERTRPTVTAIAAARAAIGAPDVPLHVRVHSDIPAERGLGSSAAVAAAIVDAVVAAHGVTLSDAQRHEAVQAAERAAHGTPSGLDARAVSALVPIRFRDGAADELVVAAPLHLVIADTGIRGRTREAVRAVRDRHANDSTGTERIIAALSGLCDLGARALAAGDVPEVGAAMTEAHALLNALGVGDPALDHLSRAAVAHGALGAKLTGGGRGGCALALATDADHAVSLAGALRAAGAAAVWETTVASTASSAGASGGRP